MAARVNGPDFPHSRGLYPALIVHTLRLQYLEEAGSKEIFFSLDGADLAVLRSVVDRAILKEATLMSLLDAAGSAHPESDAES